MRWSGSGSASGGESGRSYRVGPGWAEGGLLGALLCAMPALGYARTASAAGGRDLLYTPGMTPFRRLASLIAVATLAALMLFPAIVSAHAELVKATPEDGATVEGTPDEISAAFNESLVEGSAFTLRNAAGERLAVGRVDPDDDTRLVIDPVPELAPGVYEVRWRAASADGHRENNSWSFTVTPAPTPSPTPAPTPTSG